MSTSVSASSSSVAEPLEKRSVLPSALLIASTACCLRPSSVQTSGSSMSQVSSTMLSASSAMALPAPNRPRTLRTVLTTRLLFFFGGAASTAGAIASATCDAALISSNSACARE